MPSTLSPSQVPGDPRQPNDREAREVVTLAAAAAVVAWSLTHDPALAVAVFVAVSGALRPG